MSLSAVALLLLFTHVESGRVVGVVLDRTGQVLPNAIVDLKVDSQTDVANTRTDQRGIFRFSSVKPGSYELVIQAAGFLRAVVRSVTVAEGKETALSPVTLTEVQGPQGPETFPAPDSQVGSVRTLALPTTSRGLPSIPHGAIEDAWRQQGIVLKAGGRANGAQERAQSVCEIVTNLDRYSGKLVTVRARIQSDVDVWLAADDCKTAIRVGELGFDNLIAVAWPNSPIVKLKGPNVEFPYDAASGDRLEAALGSRDIHTQKLYANIVGMIVTRVPPLALVINRPGGPVRVGFGHLGAAPAQIIVKEISNIEVVPRP